VTSRGTPSPEEIRLPDAARRLFPDAAPALDPRRHAPHVIGVVLEDGDRRDLTWLFRTYGRERVAGWLRRRGDRQLSRRSRAFWRVVLGGAGGDSDDDTESRTPDRRSELWPL